MTREEAIKYLIKPVATSTEIGEEKQKEFEAYDMAIEALSAEPSDLISHEEAWNTIESDLISRADAEPKWNCTANFVAEQLDRLRNMTDEEKWEFFRKFFEIKGGDDE